MIPSYSKSISPGYMEECVHETGKGPKFWVSEKPTHYYDNLTKELYPLDEAVVYDKLNLSAKIVGQRYRTLEELKDSLRK
jgi:hypothetical protein